MNRKMLEKLKEEVFNYLNGCPFANKGEVSCAILEFFMEEKGILNPTYKECLIAGELADIYIKEKGLDF